MVEFGTKNTVLVTATQPKLVPMVAIATPSRVDVTASFGACFTYNTYGVYCVALIVTTDISNLIKMWTW